MQSGHSEKASKVDEITPLPDEMTLIPDEMTLIPDEMTVNVIKNGSSVSEIRLPLHEMLSRHYEIQSELNKISTEDGEIGSNQVRIVS